MNTLRRNFFKYIAQTSQNPPALDIVRGKGCYLYDRHGKEYIDCISGIVVSSLGHGNREISSAAIKQIEQHTHIMVFGEYIIQPQVELASKLASLLPKELSTVYFTNSGTEAIEGAMKLAKRVTGRSRFLAMQNAYHGSTQGALSLMGNEFFKQAFRPLLPDIGFMKFNQREDIKMIDQSVAAVFVEPVQSETGYLPAEKSFLIELRERCNQTGTLLVMDEAQTGLGRTGKMFGFEHYDIIPDILILAKALGGGFPLGAFVSSKHNMDALSIDPPLGHLTTFGGHPVSCAAALAYIAQLNQPGFLNEIVRKEALFRKLLEQAVPKEKITGMGLMIAIHLNDEQTCAKIIETATEKGLLTDWFLFAPNAIRIAPPLIINDELIHKTCNILCDAIQKNSVHCN